jgi:hypothetical protein
MAYTVAYFIWAQLQVFAHLGHPAFSPPADIVDYDSTIITIAAGCLLRAISEDLDTYISGFLSPRSVNFVKSAWSLLSCAAIGLRCIDFVPSSLSMPVDCFAAAHIDILKIASYVGSFPLALKVQELAPWTICGERYVSKPYNPWDLLEYKRAVKRQGFGTFRSISFGLFPVQYY